MAFDGPRLRRDLVSTILQEDGVKCVDVQDPERAASFRLFDYEYSVALAFDGRPLAKVIPWVRLSTGLELTAEQLTAFAARLDQLGFLESEKARSPGGAPESTPVVASADKEARTPSPTPSQPVLAEPPAAMPSQPLMEEAPASVLSQPAAVETPSPSHPALAGEKTPPPLVAESISAASPEAEAAAQETPSDALAAAETPAAVPEQPEGPLQHQPWLPAADATPAPEDSPAAPASAVELASVSPDAQPAPAPNQVPPTSPREETPSPRKALWPARSMSDGEAAEITSQSPAVLPEARLASSGPRRIVTPPPIFTPTPLVTPTRPAQVRGGPWILYALLGTLTAVVVGVLAVPLALRPHPPAAVRVRALTAKPMTVLRWFDSSAPLEALPHHTLGFPAGGKVIRLASPGTALRAGDVVAATDAARWVLADLAKQQERLAYYQRLLEGTKDTADEKRADAARAQVKFRAGLVEQTRHALSNVAVVAQAAGQVEATLTTLGQTVPAGAPAVRLQSAGWRATFELARPLTARTRKQGICGAEIEGRQVECSLALDAGDETHVAIDLPPEATTTAGQMVRLLRARFVDAFLVPASALSRVGEGDRVLVVSPAGRAEVRSVFVADQTAADVVITQGLDAGDAVVVESSQPVGAGARVRTTEATGE
jgi:hypothetical protein